LEARLAHGSGLKRGAFRPWLSRLVNLFGSGPLDVPYQGASFRFYHQASATERGALFNPDYNLEELDFLRRNIGLVFQESLLFKTSIAHNIAFGNPEASRAQVERAAKLAGAHSFISELPNGYDTVLEEGAVNLSGGQRQRTRGTCGRQPTAALHKVVEPYHGLGSE